MLRLAMIALLFIGFSTQAEVITNGQLTITVRDDNGAIDSYVMDGIDYFGQGTHVSDWGVQIGSDTSTFRLNNTDGISNIPVTVTKSAANQVDITGVINWSGKNVSFTRSIIVSLSQNAMLFSYTLNNLDVMDDVEISIFETFDPDQGLASGNGYETYNDVVSFGSLRLAQAVDQTGLTFMIGSTDSRMTLAAGNPFRISSGSLLNSFFASPFDGEGIFDDSGVHIGLRVTLAASEVLTTTAAAASAQNDDSTVAGNAIEDVATDLVSDILDTEPVVELIQEIESSDDTGTTITTVTETSESGGAIYWLLMLSGLATPLRYRKRY